MRSFVFILSSLVFSGTALASQTLFPTTSDFLPSSLNITDMEAADDAVLIGLPTQGIGGIARGYTTINSGGIAFEEINLTESGTISFGRDVDVNDDLLVVADSGTQAIYTYENNGTVQFSEVDNFTYPLGQNGTNLRDLHVSAEHLVTYTSELNIYDRVGAGWSAAVMHAPLDFGYSFFFKTDLAGNTLLVTGPEVNPFGNETFKLFEIGPGGVITEVFDGESLLTPHTGIPSSNSVYGDFIQDVAMNDDTIVVSVQRRIQDTSFVMGYEEQIVLIILEKDTQGAWQLVGEREPYVAVGLQNDSFYQLNSDIDLNADRVVLAINQDDASGSENISLVLDKDAGGLNAWGEVAELVVPFDGAHPEVNNIVINNNMITLRVSNQVFFYRTAAITPPDTDGDFIPDSVDNCTLIPNTFQRDGDGDGYGNVCDADYNNDCSVNFVDLGVMRSAFFGIDLVVDLTGDAVVNFSDLGVFRTMFLQDVGPSALTNACQ